MVVATNTVWQDISSELNNSMSKSALHVLVHKGYHGIKEKLGWTQIETPDVVLPKNILLDNLEDNGGYLIFNSN